jgi:Mg2+ and Co2+ transporter CorA
MISRIKNFVKRHWKLLLIVMVMAAVVVVYYFIKIRRSR